MYYKLFKLIPEIAYQNAIKKIKFYGSFKQFHMNARKQIPTIPNPLTVIVYCITFISFEFILTLNVYIYICILYFYVVHNKKSNHFNCTLKACH